MSALLTNNEIQTEIRNGQLQGYKDIVEAVERSAEKKAAEELTAQQKAAEAMRRGMSGQR